MMGFRFLNPEAFFLLVLIPILAFWHGRKGAAAAIEYSSGELLKSVAKASRFKAGGFLFLSRLLTLILAITAMARPQWGKATSEVESSGIDIVLAIDLSTSMMAHDFKLDGRPTDRLSVVKRVVEEFVRNRPSDRIGLMAFASRPYLVSPLTLDHDWLAANIERLQMGLVEDGTAIGSAIAASVNRLRDQKSKSRIVILLTDGLNNAGKVTPEIAADAARALGIKVYTIGAGTRGAAPVPMRDMFGQTAMRMVRVDIDEETLQRVATTTGGQYFRATDTDTLKQIYSEIDRMEKTSVTVKKFENFEELFAWFLIPALVLLALEVTLAHTLLRRLP